MSTQGLSIPGISVGSQGAGATDLPQRPNTARMRALIQRGTRTAWLDAGIVLLALLDVWLVIPAKAPSYSLTVSLAACLALAARRWLPFTTLLATIPGFFAGWAQVAAMIALGTVAYRKQLHWQTCAGVALVFLCRSIQWPFDEFLALDWREHILDAIYGVLVAGMPVAIGMLIAARSELSRRITELAESRDRERRLHAQAVRSEERTKLAREMHDLVSHDITLIAMQAGALSASNTDAEAKGTARTIRELSTHTLDELRSIVSMLRSGSTDDSSEPCLADLDDLVQMATMPVRLTVTHVPTTLPNHVSGAAYRTIQECLTNVQKYAPGAATTVEVTAGEGVLGVVVSNECPAEPVPVLPSGGYGLAGLAERARMLGGAFETSTTANGGFRVNASYPLSAATEPHRAQISSRR